MNKKAIWLIIVLMSAALIGISIIQLIWLRSSVRLQEQNFSDRVIMAMNRVKVRVMEDDKIREKTLEYFENNKSAKLFSTNENPIANFFKSKPNREIERLRYELSSLPSQIDPNRSLVNLNKDNLDLYIAQELKNQGIDLKYDYGVFSFEEESYMIINGNYVAQISDEGAYSGVEAVLDQSTAEYQVDLFSNELGSPGYLKLFFPQKTSWLWSEVLPSTLSSILLTSLILFCFSYTIYVIFRQKQISEMKTDFINNMTHEFKTPIATISLAADSINSPMVNTDTEKIKRFAGIIKQENRRMLNQVEKVLQMARIDNKDLNLRIVDVDLHEVIKKTAENVQLKLQSRNGSLSTRLEAKNAIVRGDLTHISNMVANLLDNAEKYSKDSPRIEIRTNTVTNGVEVHIKDQGIGMNKESQKHIFDKFYRVHTGNIHDVKGFGLGLSYVKALMNAHKGTVSVKSELGKGSTFTLYFPFKESD